MKFYSGNVIFVETSTMVSESMVSEIAQSRQEEQNNET